MDRRKHPRYRFQFPVSFSGIGTSGAGFALNLSREGCLVESDLSPKEGDYLEMSLSLPNQDAPLMVESAAVRWTTGRIFGVQFLYMKAAEQDRLNQFIEQMGTEELPEESSEIAPGKLPPDDRRQAARYNARFRSSFSSAKMLGGEGVVTELSIRGCRLTTDVPVPAKTILELQLNLEEGSAPVKILEAAVRWSQDQELGIEFRDIEPSSYDRLSQFLKGLSAP